MGLVDYIESVMTVARYKILRDGTYYGAIPGFKGVWASGRTLEACREELQEVLEDWILLKVRDGDRLPAIKGKALKIPATVHA